jgi:hypothetical protein
MVRFKKVMQADDMLINIVLLPLTLTSLQEHTQQRTS